MGDLAFHCPACGELRTLAGGGLVAKLKHVGCSCGEAWQVLFSDPLIVRGMSGDDVHRALGAPKKVIQAAAFSPDAMKGPGVAEMLREREYWIYDHSQGSELSVVLWKGRVHAAKVVER